MKKSDQRRIIREVMNSAKKSLLEKSARIPENWDGHELRHLCRDELAENYTFKMDRRRTLAYNRERYIGNI